MDPRTKQRTGISSAFERMVTVCMRHRMVWCTHGASNASMARLFNAVELLGKVALMDEPPSGTISTYDRQLNACLRALMERVDPVMAGYEEYKAFTAQYTKARNAVHKAVSRAGKSWAAERVGLTGGPYAMVWKR